MSDRSDKLHEICGLYDANKCTCINIEDNNIQEISIHIYNWSNQRKPLTCRKSQTLSHNVVSSTPCHEQGSNSQWQWS
jgi:hypothetical protein